MPQSVWQEKDVSDVEFSQVDMTVADSENGDVFASPKVTPRHRSLGDSDTESMSDGVSIASVHSTNTVEGESSVDVVHDIGGNSAAIKEAFLSLDAINFANLSRQESITRGNISKSKLVQRFNDFCGGQWAQLLSASASCDTDAMVARHRKRRRQLPADDVKRRAARAFG